jgi:eukaryotic-like serine/threonine-protein kinase
MVIMSGSRVFDAEGREFKVGDFLGQGGFGAVYKVESVDDKRVLALKTLTIPFSDSDELRAFINEGTNALTIKNTNVISYEFFHDGSQFKDLPPYILMEYADGGTLTALLEAAQRDAKPFSMETLWDMIGQLVTGMEAINQKLVHRDIKPDNILVVANALKISDFGLSKLALAATRNMTFKGFGSLPYIAPEAWRKEDNTILLDIYAMGMVFYELATLKHPFDLKTDDARKWMEAHLYQPVEPPSRVNSAISPGLSQLILKMVEKNAATRAKDWQVVRDLMAAANRTGSVVNPLIAGMMKKRIEADAAAQAARLKKEKEEQDQRDFGNLVIAQAHEAIIRPLEEFFADFNSQYAGGKIVTSLQRSEASLALSIRLPTAASAKIEFQALLESQYWREQKFEDYGQIYSKHVLAVPKLKGRKIQGFGLIEISGGRGFNIALVEQTGELYGEWFTLMNEVSPFSRSRDRPTPFPFQLGEIEEELRYVDVSLYRYVTKIRPLEMASIQAFFAEAIA